MQQSLSIQNRFSRLARKLCPQNYYQPLKLVFMALLFCTGCFVQAQSTYYVNDNSTANDVYTSAVGNDANAGGSADPFATIGFAISQASSGDTIYLDVGTYSETVTVNKALTINGPQKDVDPRTAAALRTAGSASEAIVDGGGASPIFNITSSGVVLNGLEIRNGSGDLIVSPGAAPAKTGVFVKYCLVNTSSGDEGIQLRNLDGGGVEYCLVSSIAGDGINLSSGCTNSYVSNNEITGSASTNGFIYLYDNGPNMLVDNNLLTGNTGENGIMIGNKGGSNFNSNSAFANNAIVSNNTVTGHAGSEVGVYINTSRVNVTDNTITGWESASNAALYLRYDIKDIVVTGNTITGNIKGVKVSSGVSAGNAPLISINQNDLSANTDGMSNSSTGVANAQLNWWGSADGPSGSGPGTGTSVTANVDFCPWLDAAPPAGMPTSTTGAVTNTNTGLFYCSIQAAIDAATTGDSIFAFAGTYTEDVLVNKSVTLVGAGMGQSTIEGPKGGDGATVRIGAANVRVVGFTITRDGNSAAEWNDGTLNFAGIAIQGQAANAEISNNEIVGNRSGIDVNNSNSNNIHNNRIHRNHTGMIFRNQTDSTNLMENSIVENRTVGVLFLDASGGSNSPLQQALNSTFNNNDISGNWYGQIVDRQEGGSLPAPGTTNIKNFECNWYGSTSPDTSNSNSAEPGYSALVPTYYGGSATDPGGQPDILGPGLANLDYILFLTDGTDDDLSTNGFQPVPGSCNGPILCRDTVYVNNASTAGDVYTTAVGNDANTGDSSEPFATLQKALDEVCDSGVVYVDVGTYPTGQVTITKAVTILGANPDQSVFAFRPNGESVIDFSGTSGSGARVTISNGAIVEMNGLTLLDTAVVASGSRSVILVSTHGDHKIQYNIISRKGGTGSGSGAAPRGIEIASIGLGKSLMIFNNLFDGNFLDLYSNNTFRSGIYYNGGDGTVNIDSNLIKWNRTGINADNPSSSGLHINNNYFEFNGTCISYGGSTPPGGSHVIMNNDFKVNTFSFLTIINLSNVASDFYLDAINNSYNDTNFTDLGKSQLFRLENQIVHGTNSGKNGLVRVNPNQVYVIPTTDNADKGSIQRGVDIASAGDTVNVDSGNYNEDLSITKMNLSLIGGGIDESVIDHSGQPGHGNAGVHILANGVTMKGLTVIDNDGGSVPRYGLKVGTSSVTTDDVTLDSIKVTQSYRTGFDLARPKNITLQNIYAINNGGAGVFMTNTEGAVIRDVTTSGNPWTGVSISTRNDWAGDASGIYFTGNNVFEEDTSDNGGVQLEMVPGKTISWGIDSSDNKDVTIQQSELMFALSGPTINAPYDPYVRFFSSLSNAQDAAGGDPDHVEIPRHIQDAFCSTTPDSTHFYVYDFADTAMTIQAAVDAAVDGNTVNVFAGEFVEQVEITKDLTLLGQGKGVTTVKGFANMPLFFTTSGDNYPVIYTHDANSVIVKDLTVDGDGQGNTNHRFMGIGYNNAGGKIANVEVKAVRHTPLNGAQGGIGIFVNAASGTGRGVLVTQCMVYDFQKTGVSFSGADLIATADSNMVTGSGSLGSGLPAQNGIQFYGTNGGNISNNQISAINYTPSTYVASGILTFYDLGTVNIFGNVLDSVEMALYGQGNTIVVSNNEANGGDYGLYGYAGDTEASSITANNNSFSKYDYGALIGNAGSGTMTSTIQNNSFTDIEGFTLYAFGTVDSIQGQCNWHGSLNPNDVENLVVGQVVYEPYLLDGTDSLPDVGFQPNPGACQSADCPDGSCEGCFAFEPYNDSSAIAGWITDRYEPDSFYVDQSDSVLVHLIDASDAQTGFTATQGKKRDIDYTGARLLSIDLYIPSSWETTGRRMAGLWGVGYDDTNNISAYPIIEFTSDSVPRFRGYDGDGSWIDMGLPCDFAYDQWYTLRIELLSTGEFLYSVEGLSVTTKEHGQYASSSIREVILQGHNAAAGVTYEINWDNLAFGNAPEVTYDTTLPEPIAVGSGISNEHMAVGEYCGIDAGLKAIQRFKGDIVPVDSNIYQVGTGVSPTNSADTAGDPGTARWNYAMSVNLGDYTFNDLNVYLDIDFDNSDSACGVGPYVADISQFMIANSMGATSVYQDAQNLGFNFWQTIGDPAILPFDPYAEGTYDLRIRIENKDGLELLNVPISVEVDCDYLDPEDNLEPPMLACPSGTTITSDLPRDPWLTGMATASGSCEQTITYSDSVVTDDCGTTGEIYRTWSMTYDDSTYTCGQTITIIDTVGPMLSGCPADTVLFATNDSGAVVMFDAPAAQDLSYFEGFENPAFVSGSGSYQGWNDYLSSLTRVASGTDGVTSFDGSAHGLLDTNGSGGTTGAYTRLGGYSSEFGDGFSTSLSIYIDLTDPAVSGDTYGWDITTAASRQNGNHLRDFVFHAASDAGGNVLIAGSNNTNFTRRNDLAGLNHHEITSSGWYTFQWVFRDSAGSLAVDLNLLDASGNHLWTETRYNAADDIASTVGGNLYMWFTFLEVEKLAIDNTQMVRDEQLSCSSESGDHFNTGISAVICSSTDTCCNSSECAFSVTVIDTAGALNFDGTDDVVNVPHAASLTGFGNSITVQAWIKPESLSGRHGIVGKWNDLGSTDRRSYLLWADEDDVQFYVSSSGADFPSALATNQLTVGEWTHVAGTFDGSTIKVYVNGSLAASSSFSGTIADNTTDPLLIGAVDGGGSSRTFFDGSIDEVRIFNRTLCEAEIAANMSCELDSTTSDLAAYYDFNQGFAFADNTGLDTLIDRSANNNQGDLENFALMGAESNWALPYDSIGGDCGVFGYSAITVFGNGQEINNGQSSTSNADSTYFGMLTVGNVNTNTFYIVNNGTDSLQVSGTNVTGDVGEFAITSLSSTSIASGDSAQLQVTYAPTSAGAHLATVELTTNDCVIGNFNFDVAGDAMAAPEVCDTLRIISDTTWRKSTTITPSSFSGSWSGVNGMLPSSSTFTQSVTLGQPYSYPTIQPVDSADVIKSGNNIEYYRKTIVLDSLTDFNTKIFSTMDNQMELYINGDLIVGQYNFSNQNGKLPGYGVRFNNDSTIENGLNGSKTYSFTTAENLDKVLKPGVNEIIYVLRNLGNSNDLGGFSFSAQIEGCEGVFVPDTNITPVDTLCDTVKVVTNGNWKESTVVTTSSYSGSWSGVNGTLPAANTFSQNVVIGQPYSFPSIDAVDSADVISAGNNIRYFRETLELDSLVDLRARIRGTFDNQVEVYVNGQLLVANYNFNNSNSKFPPFDARFNSDGTVDNGVDGNKTYSDVTSDSLGLIFTPGTNEIIVVLRNLSKPSDLGGFSLSLQVDGCQGEVLPDTTAPADSLTTVIVSDGGWDKSTQTEASTYSGNWSGASSIPPDSTYTLAAVVGQPYPWNPIDAVDSAQVIKTENNITFFRRMFELTDNVDLDARFRMTVDDAMEIYVNGILIARENNSGSANWDNPNHDLHYFNGTGAVNGFSGGDSFDVVPNIDLDTVFTSGMNQIVLAIRNKAKSGDAGGFSFRLDLDKGGSPVIVKTGETDASGEVLSAVFDFVLFPNPTTGMVNIDIRSAIASDDNQIIVQDASGRILQTKSFDSGAATGDLQIDMSGYAAGMYIVRVRTGSKAVARRVIKQ